MTLYLQLFWSFFQVGLFSFGGGLATMPLIQDQVVNIHHWLTLPEFTDLITISQMTPGPIAVNSASFVGMRIAGIPGSLIATFACILPACNNVYFRQVPPQRSFLASSITLSALNIGAFLGTPYISLIEAFGGEPMTCLLISPVFLVVMGLISIRVMKKGQRLDA